MTVPTLDIERAIWNDGVEPIAGVDEAGRGPLAGPVVAAAVVFPRDVTIPGVNDSKKLRERDREELFDAIRAAASCVGVGIVDHETIDRVNILQATVRAMHQAIDALTVPPAFLLVDGNYFRHERLKFRTVVDGDALSFTIAAASVIAKVTRDRLMREYDREFPEYGFIRHKGYGTPEHLAAIRRYGLCTIHRRSFRMPCEAEGISVRSSHEHPQHEGTGERGRTDRGSLS